MGNSYFITRISSSRPNGIENIDHPPPHVNRRAVDDYRANVEHRVENALSVACANGHLEIVELLMKRDNLLVNSHGDYGCSPFYSACQRGRTEVVRFMIKDSRVDVNNKTLGGVTPLIIACNNERIEVIKILLDDERVDVNARDVNGRYALSESIELKKNEIIEIFAQAKISNPKKYECFSIE